MKAWSMRPVEVAALLNPAFCAFLLRKCAQGFSKTKPDGIPYPVLALCLPLVLHRVTREVLPVKVTSRMHSWLQKHQEIRVGFAQRCAALMPYYREAMLFAFNGSLLTFTNAGHILALPDVAEPKLWLPKSEPAKCMERALFVGRWLSGAGDVRTIYAMWGIRP